jgi:hypothetical protein
MQETASVAQEGKRGRTWDHRRRCGPDANDRRLVNRHRTVHDLKRLMPRRHKCFVHLNHDGDGLRRIRLIAGWSMPAAVNQANSLPSCLSVAGSYASGP